MTHTAQLKDICIIAPSKSEIKNHNLEGGAMVSFLPMEDLRIGAMHITPSKSRRLEEVSGSYTYFKEGDILLAKVTPCFENGKVGIATGLVNGVGYGSSEFIVIRPDTSKVVPAYLYYRLHEDSFRREGRSLMVGACGLKRLPKSYVAETSISLPSIPEQERIVGVLDNEFAKIDRLRSNAEQNLRHAKDLFQAALRAELEPRDGWKVIKLKEISTVRVGPFGSCLHKNDYISGGTPLINPIHMKDGVIVPSPDFSVSGKKLQELSNYILKEGDVVFARRGEIGRCALVSKKEDGFLCGTGSLFVRFNSPQNSSFMMNLLDSPAVKEQLLSRATGATMLNINSSMVENLEVCLPPKDVQHEIQNTLCILSNRCKILQDNYSKTAALCDDLKQALLRKAFNGEL